MSLFQNISQQQSPGDKTRPLAERMRPRTLDEFVGQEHLIGEGRMLPHHQKIRSGWFSSQ